MRPLLRALSTLLLAPILTTSAAHAQYSIDKVVFHNAAQIDSQLCQKATAAVPCPTGTTADSSMICRYDNDPTNACASIIIGTDGHVNLGTLLQSISPGTQGGLDFLFAAGGPDVNTNDPAGLEAAIFSGIQASNS